MGKEKPTPYEGTKPYIFISHCHGDGSKKISRELITYLHDRGYRVWFTKESPLAKDMNEIREKITDSALCLFLITKEWVRTNHCDQEISHAKETHANIVPVFLEEVRLTPKLRSFFEGMPGFKKADWSSSDDFYEELAAFPVMEKCREPRVREIHVEKVLAKRENNDAKKGNKLFKKLKSFWK